MKILSVQAQNFASYKELNFEFDNQGLCLIQGPTGSGKSTLCDILPWTLFGITAKDGAADEVIPFNAEGPTQVTIQLEINNQIISITRTRGPNDLYFIEYDEYAHGLESRGKDLNDTQKQINNLLGMDAETYLAGAYFHEFSKTAQFFNTSAKNRRLITEQIVDLSIPKSIQTKVTDQIRHVKSDISKIEQNILTSDIRLSYLDKAIKTAQTNHENFEKDQEARLEQLRLQAYKFEDTREYKLNRINRELEAKRQSANTQGSLVEQQTASLKDDACPTCGTHLDNKDRIQLTKLQQNLTNTISDIKRLNQDLLQLNTELNPYLEQLETEKPKTNTYNKEFEDLQKEHDKFKAYNKVAKADLANAQTEYADLELLADINDSFRSTLICDTVGFVQNHTNELLSTYFDAEIKVLFDTASADKLEVTIYKDSNECSYTQLSKGQRQLLKLTFGLAIMKAVQNAKGISFNAIFLDESLDGMSEELKVKAYRLFESLALDYPSVFFVDHSNELKSLANRKYNVTINNGVSNIEEA